MTFAAAYSFRFCAAQSHRAPLLELGPCRRRIRVQRRERVVAESAHVIQSKQIVSGPMVGRRKLRPAMPAHHLPKIGVVYLDLQMQAAENNLRQGAFRGGSIGTKTVIV